MARTLTTYNRPEHLRGRIRSGRRNNNISALAFEHDAQKNHNNQ